MDGSRHGDHEVFEGEGFFVPCERCGGYHRDPDLRFAGLVSQAVPEVTASTETCLAALGADQPGGNWQFDAESAVFTVTNAAGAKAHARFHSVGTWLSDTGSFRWSWAQETPDQTLGAARKVREVGMKYGFQPLVCEEILVGRREAWHLAMVTAWLSGLPIVTTYQVNDQCQSFIAVERPLRAS